MERLRPWEMLGGSVGLLLFMELRMEPITRYPRGIPCSCDLLFGDRMSFVPIPTGTAPGSVRKEVRLLVVDDTPEHFELLAEVAEMYNPEYRVECRLVSTAFETFEAVGEWQPSVVLVDLHSVADALAVVRQLAEQGRSVVATSQHRSSELSSVADQYGAVGYLSKSDNPDDVEALVEFVATVSSPPDPNH